MIFISARSGRARRSICQQQGLRLGFPVDIVPQFSDAGRSVSSGAIRAALTEGKVAEAAELLGAPWFVSGEVIHGDKRGRELGFPTANIRLDPDCGLRHGIYAVRVDVDGKRYDGVASFGIRPMFETATPLLEVFLFDFDGDLYGQTIDVAFIAWLRGEQKFASLDDLKAAIAADSARRARRSKRPGTRFRCWGRFSRGNPAFCGLSVCGIRLLHSAAMTKPERDYSETLFLPQTEFPMRAGLPQKEPELLKRWEESDLYGQLRAEAKGREKFVLHDGPPYANGNIHIGHALNKILKDVVTRSQQMLGYDSNYVPGWDCHGLPIEWKIEEENYRSKNKAKPNFSDPAAMVAFRQECRAYAQKWLEVQREEFKRLGVEGDWDHPYTTMSFPAEAQIARELMKFAANGLLYRGSKPVMWSVVEKTALAEAEIEYEDYTSDTVWVKFPVKPTCMTLIRRTVLTTTALALQCFGYHLDHDAVDVAGQSRDLVFAENQIRTLSKSPMLRRIIGRSSAICTFSPKISPATFSSRPRSRPTTRSPTFQRTCLTAWSASIRSPAKATTSTFRFSPAITSPTTPAPASFTPRPAMAATTSKSGWTTRPSWKRAASVRPFPIPSMKTAR